MKLKLKDIDGLLPMISNQTYSFDRGFNYAIEEIGEREIEVEVCRNCIGFGIIQYGNIKKDCPRCHSGIVIRSVKQ